jgi:hypothetical protein
MGGSGAIMKAMGQQNAPAPTSQPGYGSNYQAPQSTPYAPRQQASQVSPFVQQQRAQMMQQQMPPQMRGIGQQQPGLQSMLSRILGYGGGGGYGMPQQMQQGMPPQMMQQGMPSYGRFGGGQNPLAYRPDMQAAQNNTGNVAIGVAEQQRRALQAQLDAANAQLAQQQSGGGGE